MGHRVSSLRTGMYGCGSPLHGLVPALFPKYRIYFAISSLQPKRRAAVKLGICHDCPPYSTRPRYFYAVEHAHCKTLPQ